MDACNSFTAKIVKKILGGSVLNKHCLQLKKNQKKTAVKHSAKTKLIHSASPLILTHQFLSEIFYLSIDCECQSYNLRTIT
ncbi:MAG: hypothetical protein D8M61_04765 [Ignavibacteriae bacterium]|nr:hypothetical protein [Ignavibacteriota bacterium]